MITDLLNDDHFAAIQRRMERDFPFLRVSRLDVHGDTVLKTAFHGMRIFSVYHGRGEVFLPKGYRTQEGDGAPRPIGGGMAQTEFYIVLDANDYGLSTAGEESRITLFPDLSDLNRYETHRLKPGSFVYMPPGTGHRGQNVFASIMTVPGFKPGNELYLDCDIFERTGGRSPYNENHLESKNYKRLEDFF